MVALLPYDDQISELVASLSTEPQREMPVQHRFQDGVYLREIFMPADTFVIGHRHRTAHANIILTGVAQVMMDGEMRLVQAGDVFQSEAGVQKILYVAQDMRWITVHANPDNGTDIAAIEERLADMDAAYLDAKGQLTLDEFRLLLATPLLS